MERDRDLGMRALQAGYLTETQLAECLRDPAGRPLLDVLKSRGFLTAAQAELLAAGVPLEGNRPADQTRTADDDGLLGAIALEWNLLDPERLREALQEKEETLRSGRNTFLGQILLERGAVTAADLARLLQEQSRRSAGPGLTFTRYEVTEKLGEGATAVVYKARDRELGRWVALKVLRDSVGLSDIARQRFQREARVTAGLDHPYVVTVHDAGQENGYFFQVMEFVEGRPLAEILKTKEFEERTLLELIRKVAQGVGEAHRRGIVHRDLKPANILVTTSGEPKVGDFGLAHLADSASELTRTGAVLGTPLYMSPEQVVGRSDLVSPRSDVYSLGAILYEILAGRPPHVGETLPEIYRMIKEEDPVPLDRLSPQVSRDLHAIVKKTLEKDPEARYQDATLLAEDLRRYLAGESIQARSPSWAMHLWRKVGRAKVLWWIPVPVAVLILAWGQWMSLRRRDPEESVVPPPPDLEAYWKFDEGRGLVARDSSGHDHHGTLDHGPRWVPGRLGGALEFGQDSSVVIPSASSLMFKLSDSFTVAAWVQSPFVPEDYRGLVTKSRDVKPHYGLWIVKGKWSFGGTMGNIEGVPVTPGWHHLAGVQNARSNQRFLYVDGVQVGTGILQDADGPGVLRIGGATDMNEYFTGMIDDVRIYRRALTPAELIVLANGGK
jgi:serine/threonine protein kinase